MQRSMRDALGSRRSRLGLGANGMVAAAVVIAVALPAGAGANKRAFQDVHRSKAFWHKTSLKTALERRRGARPVLRLRARHDRSFTLNRSALRKVLAAAPRAHARRPPASGGRLATGPGRPLPALRAHPLGDHVARPGQEAS